MFSISNTVCYSIHKLSSFYVMVFSLSLISISNVSPVQLELVNDRQLMRHNNVELVH